MKIPFAILTLCLTATAIASDIGSPKELYALLQAGKAISVEGRVPSDWKDFIVLPMRADSTEQLQKVAAFLKEWRFTIDAETTRALKEGSSFSTLISLQVVIDDRYVWEILGPEAAIFSNNVAYRVTPLVAGGEAYFSEAFLRLLGSLKKEK